MARPGGRAGNRESPARCGALEKAATGGAAYFLRAPLTAVLRPAPGENFGALLALIFTVSPVCGLRPVRALRLTTENLPKPVIAISSPFLRVFSTVEMSDSTALRASVLLRPLSLATASTSSVLFMRLLLDRRQTERRSLEQPPYDVPCRNAVGTERSPVRSRPVAGFNPCRRRPWPCRRRRRPCP